MKKQPYARRIFLGVTALLLIITAIYHQYIPCSFEDLSGLDGSIRRDNIAGIHGQLLGERRYTGDPEDIDRISRALLEYLNDFTYQYDLDFDFRTVFPDGLHQTFPQTYLTYRREEGRTAVLAIEPLDGTHIRIGYRYYTVLDGTLDAERFIACLEWDQLDTARVETIE